MNKGLRKQAGFADEVNIWGGKCPFCKVSVDKSSFRNELSLREFRISGLCQVCQDETFGED